MTNHTQTFETPEEAMDCLGLNNTRKEFNRFTGLVYFSEEVMKVGNKQCYYCFDSNCFIVTK